jgi:hypothetical protein
VIRKPKDVQERTAGYVHEIFDREADKACVRAIAELSDRRGGRTDRLPRFILFCQAVQKADGMHPFGISERRAAGLNRPAFGAGISWIEPVISGI